MSKKAKGVTRREFLLDTALASGAVALTGLAPTTSLAGQAEPKLGAQFIGKLEGPEIIRDVAKFPKAFKEAPMLAELVKAGKLPPVEQRLPEAADLMVIKPLKEIGKYGGRWRRGFTGPADTENGNRIVSTDKILMWDYTGNKVAPCLAKDWRLSDDGKVCTIFLRKGLKWSDGQPFTADDFLFWYEDIYQNKELVPTPAPEFTINGKPGRMYKRDDYTVVFEFPEPYFLFVDILAGDTLIGGGQATGMARASFMGGYAPAHYLKQFLPKYSSADEVTRKAKAADFDSWVSYFRNRTNWALNPDLPVLGPWKTVSPINTPTWAMERNPYYWAVDTAGNQLPYIDRIVMNLAENLEVLNLRAIAGEYDLQERHVSLNKLPVFIENQKKGNYSIRLDTQQSGLRRGHARQHRLRGRPRDLQVAQDPGLPPGPVAGDRPRSAQRGVLAGHRDARLVRAGGRLVQQPGQGVSQEVGRRWISSRPTSMLDKIGLTQEGRRGLPPADRRQGATPDRADDGGRPVHPVHPGRRDDQAAVEEDRHRRGREGDRAQPGLHQDRQRGTPHHVLDGLRVGEPLPLPAPRPAGGYRPNATSACPSPAGTPPTGPRARSRTTRRCCAPSSCIRSAAGKKEAERTKIAQEIWKIIVEECWVIGTVGLSPAFMGVRITKNNMGNIPARQTNAQHARTPNTSHPATFFFKS